MLRNPQKSKPAGIIETGRVKTHAMSRFRTVPHCRPV
jgi:hypothetical protein